MLRALLRLKMAGTDQVCMRMPHATCHMGGVAWRGVAFLVYSHRAMMAVHGGGLCGSAGRGAGVGAVCAGQGRAGQGMSPGWRMLGEA
jgi:hypothetical protein